VKEPKDEEEKELDKLIDLVPDDEYVDRLLVLLKNINLHWNGRRVKRNEKRRRAKIARD
jgi:hypothetical protein